ncbi:unnamed protein product [Rhodiola kirilowii]
MTSARNSNTGWDFHLRLLTSSSRDSTDPASDPSIIDSVKKLCEICRAEKSEDLAARVYPHLNKIFQRSVASSISQSRTSNGILLLAILQFFLDYESEFADPQVAEATLDFIIQIWINFLPCFLLYYLRLELIFRHFIISLIVQFFPLMLKLIAWNGERLLKPFLKVFPAMISNGSFLPLLPSLMDMPILVVALEKVERSSGITIGTNITSIQKSAAPEMLLALMDEAYTGSTIGDGREDSESDDNNTMDAVDPMYLELLKDENDGLAARHWASGMAATLQAIVNVPRSEKLKQALNMAPRLLDVYFSRALHDVTDSLICALIPLLMLRYATIFPDINYSYEVRRRLLEFMLSAFQRYPNFIALLKKPIMDRLGDAYDSPEKTELAMHLCWAIGEHGGGGVAHKDAAREHFDSLELLLYENLSSSRLGLSQGTANGTNGPAFRKSSQSRLLCYVVTAISKLATFHNELLPRARVSLAKLVTSYANLLLQDLHNPLKVRSQALLNGARVGTKMISHIPFYLLGENEGPPFHDFSFSEILPKC